MHSTPAGRWLTTTAGLWGLLAIGLGCPAAAWSQEPEPDAQQSAPVASGSGPLVATITAEILREQEGPGGKRVRTWEPATHLVAGEEIYYTIRVRNPGKQPVTGVTVTKRLPFGVLYKRGSAVGPACEVQFSIDGGTQFAPADRLGAANGDKPGRKVPVSEYTHVRWILSRPLAPGATALLRFRATFT
jgi:uncharacterized repeat protein (TIGR01451 family)